MTQKKSPTPKTLSIGGATFDLFVRTAREIGANDREIRLPLGAKIRVESVIEACGGGACNSAVGLSRLGCSARFCGVLGSDQWGQTLLANLKKENVDVTGATIVEGETTSFSLILSVESGERSILYTPGTNAHLGDMTFDRESAVNADWIYLNHLTEESCSIQDDILAIFQDLEAPLRGLTWNPGDCQIERGIGDPAMQNLLARTSLLVLNKEEVLAFTNVTSVEAAIPLLLAIGIGVICITDGKNGTIGATSSQTLRCSVDGSAKVVDTTGAGDAFGTGATWALLQGLDLPKILRAGTINAASVIESMGAQAGLLTDIDIRTRLEKTTIDVRKMSL